MISSEDALRILQGWRAGAVKLSFNTGTSMNGVLEEASSDAVTVISGGKKVVIPLGGVTFRVVPRNEVKIASMLENWSESIEIRLPSGAFALLLKLSDKPVTRGKED
jgi:hypothetical protein